VASGGDSDLNVRMSAGLCRLVLGVILMACLGPVVADDAESVRYAGRPVIDVLQALRGPGLEFIYSSELLPRTYEVKAEPASRNRLLLAREILAPHGLALSVVRPGLYAVVPAKQRVATLLVRGRVLRAQDGEPIAAARVQLRPLGASDWSNADGRFAIGPVPEGDYSLHVEAAGFEDAVLSGLAVAAEMGEAEVRLLPDHEQLSEVVVSTSRYAVDRAGALGALNIDGDTLAFQPVIGEDALRALGRLPGIAQNGMTAQSNIRGGETGELLTMLDGFPLRQAFHLPGYQSVFGVIDPGLVDDAVVYTGGFPVRYGNRLGGVFDLSTVDAEHEPQSALGLSVFNAMGRHGGRYERLNVDWLGAARVGALRPIIEWLGQDSTRPSYADVYARIGYGEPDRLRLTANVLWSRDELGIEREGYGESAQLESRNRYLWLRAERAWDNAVAASLSMGQSSIDSFRRGSVDREDITAGSVTDRRASDYLEALGRVTWQPGARHWLEGGFEWTDESAAYNYSADAAYAPAVAELFGIDPQLQRDTALEPQRERVAVYAAYRAEIADALTSEIGLRAQRTITRGTTAEDWLFDPRFGLRWQVAPAWDLRAHWGRFHQTDEVHELKVEDGLTAFPEAQEADHFILGVDHRLRNGLALRAEWFRKVLRDPRPHFENLLDPLTVLPEIAADRVRVAPNAAEVRGAEVSAVSEGPELTWWTGLTWSEAWDGVEGIRVARSWDQTWSVTAGVDWVRGSWRFGAVASAHRGWPTTLIEDSGLGGRNEARFPTRAAIDLRAEYRRPLAIGSLAFTFELMNALNIGNTCCYKLLAEDDGSGVTFTTNTSDWLPLVPSMGVLWEF
jgi:TonB dependent receptor/Carboxypeptidase regulatory-like domain/TonB-dependent Receptor Plug Domain